MNREKYFLEAINASEPNADLVYADWLEEQGRPEADEVRDPVLICLTDFWSHSFSNSWAAYHSWSWSRCHRHQYKYGSTSGIFSYSCCRSSLTISYWYWSRSQSRSLNSSRSRSTPRPSSSSIQDMH